MKLSIDPRAPGADPVEDIRAIANSIDGMAVLIENSPEIRNSGAGIGLACNLSLLSGLLLLLADRLR